MTRDWQKLRIQETDNDDVREVGRIPRTIDVELVGDLIDTTIPGKCTIYPVGAAKNVAFSPRPTKGGQGKLSCTRKVTLSMSVAS